jgi:predicted amidohydrolase YtcJ
MKTTYDDMLLPPHRRARAVALAVLLHAAGALTAALTLGACATTHSAVGVTAAGPLWLHGGRVWTGDASAPSATALFVRDGRVVAIGSDAEVANLAKGTPGVREVDLAGRVVVPGFIDAHVHILSGGLGLDRLDLAGARSREATLAAIAAYAKAHPERPWILGRGWSYDLWKPGFPSREELDRAVPDRPVYLRSYDGHSAWANSRALALAGIDERTPEPKDGRVVRVAGTQRPQGTLLEEAVGLVGDKVPKPSIDERKAAIRRALSHAAQFGVTTLCEVGDDLEDLSVYAALDREGGLALRVVYGPSIDDGIDAYAKVRARLLAERRPGAMLSPGPLKGFVDGVVESNTAGMLAPYADGSGAGAPPHLTKEKILEQVRAADRQGLDVAYHAIGDGSVRAVLDAVEDVQRSEKPWPRRPRIEHVEVVSKEDVPRFSQLGVVASMMPAHAEPGDEPEGGVWAKKVGPERLHRAFAFASLLDARARLAFGSDWPVAPIDPLKAIAIAVTRQGADGKPAGGWVPEQRISVDAALAGYTSGAAYAVRLDDQVGVLARGRAADLAVLSREADLAQPASLFGAKVDLTAVAGRVVYERR